MPFRGLSDKWIEEQLVALLSEIKTEGVDPTTRCSELERALAEVLTSFQPAFYWKQMGINRDKITEIHPLVQSALRQISLDRAKAANLIERALAISQH